MTNKGIIAEFILQNIRQDDLVEIGIKDSQTVKGQILDKDVFPVLNSKLQLQNILYNAGIMQPQLIRILLLSDENRQKTIKMANLISFALPQFRSERQIPIEDIISITKIID